MAAELARGAWASSPAQSDRMKFAILLAILITVAACGGAPHSLHHMNAVEGEFEHWQGMQPL